MDSNKKKCLKKWVGILKATLSDPDPIKIENGDPKISNYNHIINKISTLIEELREEGECSKIPSCVNCESSRKELAEAHKLVTALTEKCTELYSHIDDPIIREMGIHWLPSKIQLPLEAVTSQRRVADHNTALNTNEAGKNIVKVELNEDENGQEPHHKTQSDRSVCKEDIKSDVITLILKDADELPQLTEENYLQVVAQNPTVRFYELKSAMSTFSVEECRILNKRLSQQGYSPNFCPVTPGWLEDTVIDYFLDRVCCWHENMVAINSALALCYFSMSESTTIPCKTPGGNEIFWKKVDMALFPINIDNGHWTLVAVWPKKSQYAVMDSMSSEQTRDPIIQDGIQKLGKCLDINFQKRIMKSSRQQNGWDCGVFVCAYAYFLIRGEKPDHFFDCTEFRKFIIATIIDPDEQTAQISQDNCYDGSSDDKNRELDDMSWFEETEI